MQLKEIIKCTKKSSNKNIQTRKKELIGTAPLSRVSSEIFSTKDSSLKISQRSKKKSFSWFNHQQALALLHQKNIKTTPITCPIDNGGYFNSLFEGLLSNYRP